MSDTDLNLRAEPAPRDYLREKVHEFMDQLEEELGERPTAEQMVEAMGVKQSKIPVMESLMEDKE
jgi:DNA-directed RNA polymerase sigma subunit (sigma70/sigma32)